MYFFISLNRATPNSIRVQRIVLLYLPLISESVCPWERKHGCAARSMRKRQRRKPPPAEGTRAAHQRLGQRSKAGLNA